MTKIIAYLPGLKEKPLPPRRVDSSIPGDRWLKQIENAQFSNSRPEEISTSIDKTSNPILWKAALQAEAGYEATQSSSSLTRINSAFNDKNTRQLTPLRREQQSDAANQRDNWLRQMELDQLSAMNKFGSPVLFGHDKTTAKLISFLEPASYSPSISKPATEPKLQGITRSAHKDERINSEIKSKDKAVKHTAATAEKNSDIGSLSACGTQNFAGKKQQSLAQGDSDTQSALKTPIVITGLSRSRGVFPTSDSAFDAQIKQLSLGNMTPKSAVQQANPDSLNAPQNNLSPSRQTAQPNMLSNLFNPSSNLGNDADSDYAESVATSEESPAHVSQSAEYGLGEKLSWQERLMHMTSDGDNVKLWIRDHKINQSQLHNLTYRLAGDIASAGMRLNTVTVNGRLTFRATNANNINGNLAGERYQNASATSDFDHEQTRIYDSILSPTENQHGTK